MAAKATRIASEMKAIVAEICNSKEFIQCIFEHVEKCATKIKETWMESLTNTVMQNIGLIEELRKENEELKGTVQMLKSELVIAKSQTISQGKPATVSKDKVNNIEKRAKDKAERTNHDNVNIQGGPSILETQSNVQERPLDNEGFAVIQRKGKRTLTKTVGAAQHDRSGGLLIGVAQTKTAWFYVGKIKNKDVATEVMENYIIQQEGAINVSVEKLESKGEYAAFKVGVPFDRLEKLNDPEYWPQGVIVRRFNFWKKNMQRREHFLDVPKVSGRPGTSEPPKSSD